MCAIDDAERFAVYETTTRKARKPHKCHGCGREIAAGERYEFSQGLMAGDGWWKEKLCAHCMVGAGWLMAECGGYCMGGSTGEIHEHAQEYRSVALWRLAAGAGRKWQRFDGAGLMPIPKMPPLSESTHA